MTFRSLALSILFSVTGFACSTPRPAAFSPAADVTLTHREAPSGPSAEAGHVGTYISSWRGFRTSSYWIEGPTGLILIDTQFLPSAAEEMVNLAESTTGKKALLAIILHPNPDKFNGTAIFQKHGIRVVTSQQILELIPAVHRLRTAWFYDDFKPDYPVETPHPDSFGSSTRELTAGGITVKAHVLGRGCSDAHVVVEYGKHVFVGDLITQGFHSWLELGALPDWLTRLDEISAMDPDWVHTGRGGSGDSDLIDREKGYLESVIAVVKKHRPSKSHPLTEKTGEQIEQEILARYPAYDYPRFIGKGLRPLWTALAK